MFLLKTVCDHINRLDVTIKLIVKAEQRKRDNSMTKIDRFHDESDIESWNDWKQHKEMIKFREKMCIYHD
jgi:hypothetical protein